MQTVGVVFMIVGAAGLVVSFALWSSWGSALAWRVERRLRPRWAGSRVRLELREGGAGHPDGAAGREAGHDAVGRAA